MPVSFLNPALLFGTAAAALPVIIHFLSRRKVRREKFSDLRFLEEIQSQQARRVGVRRWLLLLLRVLTVLCIALGVAGPRWGRLATAHQGSRSVLFVIDGSASMQTQYEDDTRFAAAVAACADMIGALDDEAAVQVLLAADRTEPLFDDWLPAGLSATGGLAVLDGTDGAFDLAPVLREAARQVARAPGTPVEVVLLSDLQAVPVTATEALQQAADRLLGAGRTRFMVRRVGAPVATGGVLAVDLPARAVQPGETVVVTATVLARDPEQVFTLEIDGLVVAEAVAQAQDLPQRLDFAVSVPAAGVHRGRIVTGSDAFAVDDVRPFVLWVPERIEVLLVHGRDRAVDSVAGRGGWRYLAEALSPPGEAGAFAVTPLDGQDLTTGALAVADVAFFVDIDPLGRQATQSLRQWLDGGGGAAFLMGEPTAATYLQGSLLDLLGLPAEVQWRKLSTQSGERWRVVDRNHPLLRGFDEAAVTTLTEALFGRYFALQPGSAVPLLSFESDAPALLTGDLDEGRFVLLPFDLLPASTDLPANPMALPLWQRLAGWLAGPAQSGPAENILVADVPRITLEASRVRDGALENPAELSFLDEGTGLRQTADVQWRRQQPILSGPVAERAGFLTCLAGADTLGVVAVAVPAAESTAELADPATWLRRLEDLGLDAMVDLSDVVAADFVAALAGRDLAPWLFALAVVLLMLESYVGRRAGS